MRFSLRINNDLPVRDYVALAQAAERAGFDQFWVSNDLFLRSAPVILTAIAGATERIGIGTCILNPYTIHPAEIAMFAATLDEWSGGRFHLGLAAGAAEFLKWVGLPQTAPLDTTRRAMVAIRTVLNGGRGGDPAWTDDAYLRFGTPGERQIPIYLGAFSPRMLGLAGELADGVLPLLFPPESYDEVVPLIEAGRSAPVARWMISISPPASGARSAPTAPQPKGHCGRRSPITVTPSAPRSGRASASRAPTSTRSSGRS